MGLWFDAKQNILYKKRATTQETANVQAGLEIKRTEEESIFWTKKIGSFNHIDCDTLLNP